MNNEITPPRPQGACLCESSVTDETLRSLLLRVKHTAATAARWEYLQVRHADNLCQASADLDPYDLRGAEIEETAEDKRTAADSAVAALTDYLGRIGDL